MKWPLDGPSEAGQSRFGFTLPDVVRRESIATSHRAIALSRLAPTTRARRALLSIPEPSNRDGFAMRLPTLALGFALAGCTSMSPSLVGRYSLSPEAMHRSGAHDLYDAVRLLRPDWLEPCTSVYRDERFWGGTEALHEFVPEDAVAVKYIPSGHPRPGAGQTALNTCSAIQVVTGGP